MNITLRFMGGKDVFRTLEHGCFSELLRNITILMNSMAVLLHLQKNI